MTQGCPIKPPHTDFSDDKDRSDYDRFFNEGMTQRNLIKPPCIDFCDDKDWSDCDRFLNECIDALIGEIAGAILDPPGALGIVANMLEARAAQLKPTRGRPPGSRNKNRGPAGSASTRARRKREERERAEQERAIADAFKNA